MKIERIILRGFTLFKLDSVDYLDYTPEKMIQVILGSNGSGKSSLLRELSPLPADKNFFNKPGGKEIWISHEGRHYHLSSIFDDEGNRYLFECDGENLNPGFTITVFKELVKQHFLYTPELHRILMKQVLFHDMSVADRRSWFMQISDKDYTYALGYYGRLKERVKEYQILLKQFQFRLVKETEKIVSEEEMAKLKAACSEEREIIRTLFAFKSGVSRQTNISQLDYLLTSLGSRLEGELQRFNSFCNTTPIDQLRMQHKALEHEVIILREKYENKCRAVTKLDNQLNELNQLPCQDAAVIEAEIKEINKEIEVCHHAFSFPFRLKENIAEAEQQFFGMKTGFIDVSHILTDAPQVSLRFEDIDYTYTRDNFQFLVAKDKELEDTEKKAEANLREIERKLKELDIRINSERTSCPRCNHTWINNYNAAEHQQLKEKEKYFSSIYESIVNKRSILQMILLAFQTHFNCLSTIQSFNKKPYLAEFFSYLAEKNYYLDNPGQLQIVMQQLGSEFEIYRKLETLTNRINELNRHLLVIKSSDQKSKEILEKTIAEDNKEIIQIQQQLSTKKNDYEATSLVIKTYDTVQSIYQDYMSAYKERQTAILQEIQYNGSQAVQELIHHYQLSISEKERRITQADTQRTNVENFKREITQLEDKIRLLKVAMVELSPTEGLIAKGMTSFINGFIQDMNDFIEEFWLYPMEIIPVEIKEEDAFDLDYKFSIRVNNNDNDPTPDVSVASEGMKEIINLAFVIVTMSYIGLKDYPIFLDEFAVKMDEAHRAAAYEVIDRLTERLGFSQLFIVSHYQSGYSALNEADISVLHGANVSLPSHLTYNRCLVMR